MSGRLEVIEGHSGFWQFLKRAEGPLHSISATLSLDTFCFLELVDDPCGFRQLLEHTSGSASELISEAVRHKSGLFGLFEGHSEFWQLSLVQRVDFFLIS